MSSFGEALSTARRALGQTQEDLAHAAGVTQAALSRYETGMREPEPDVIQRLADALGITPAFLTRLGSMQGAMAVDAHMRRRATAKATTWRQLEARLNMYRMHIRCLMEEISLKADQRVPSFDPIDTDPADAARMVRMQWRMPIGPVRSLARRLEAAGCVLIAEDFGTPRVDGLSQWVDDYPVILVNLAAPTDRLRLTLAHELGHLCLHSLDATPDMEQEADMFAAEFLMPEEVIRPQLRNLTLGKLMDLKREWGTSMQALIERAHNLKVITSPKREYLYKQLSARGWRTREPLSEQLPPERAELARHIGETLADRGLSQQEVAEMAGFADPSKNTIFVAGRRLRAV